MEKIAGGKKTIDMPVCMFRVPQHVKKNNEAYYEPKFISIGPYHHEKEHLQEMEDHKWRYLYDFLSRDPNKKLDEYLTVMRTLVPSVRERYCEKIHLTDDELAEIILLDGCFILELFTKWVNEIDPILAIPWNT
ncbi:hypothetical protein LUZ60_017285 [Juncus effusus]|nr:hypothetical protein LUZ60_017285 [Juncus effusus]